MSKVEEVRGKLVTLRFEASKCIHSRGCVLGRPDVFVPNVEGEWIHPDAATPDEIAELAHNCPSGAITYERSDGGPQELPPKVNLIKIRENGPLAVYADLTIEGNGSMLRATLCRCGHSANKPFCDGAHASAGFVATGEPATKPSEPLALRDGPLRITPAENGPLLVSGPAEVVSGTGRTTDRCEKAALCRCGQSANKPYCDGTHRKVGFVAPGAK
ncbi:MAG: CDGSH iron-sulfur domain-containing protein [Kofleriaceae bacterium]